MRRFQFGSALLKILRGLRTLTGVQAATAGTYRTTAQSCPWHRRAEERLESLLLKHLRTDTQDVGVGEQESDEDIKALMAAQHELRPDVDILEAFGETIPDIWTGVRFVGHTLVALVTEPDACRDELLRIVAHPDQIEVREAQHSRAFLDDVYREALELVGQASHRCKSHGPGLERAHIALNADEDALAATLYDRFGDALEIRLGRHLFPLSSASVALPPSPAASIVIPGLRLVAELERDSWRSGDTIRGHLRMTNASADDTITFDTGEPMTGVLLDLDGTPVGGYTGAIAGVGRRVHLNPGDQATLGFISGADTFDPHGGAVLPAGRYLLVVSLDVGAGTQPGVLVSPPVHVQLE